LGMAACLRQELLLAHLGSLIYPGYLIYPGCLICLRIY